MDNRIFLVLALFLIAITIIGGYILVKDDKKDISEKYVYNGTDNVVENSNDNDTKEVSILLSYPVLYQQLYTSISEAESV